MKELNAFTQNMGGLTHRDTAGATGIVYSMSRAGVNVKRKFVYPVAIGHRGAELFMAAAQPNPPAEPIKSSTRPDQGHMNTPTGSGSLRAGPGLNEPLAPGLLDR